MPDYCSIKGKIIRNVGRQNSVDRRLIGIISKGDSPTGSNNGRKPLQFFVCSGSICLNDIHWNKQLCMEIKLSYYFDKCIQVINENSEASLPIFRQYRAIPEVYVSWTLAYYKSNNFKEAD